MIEVVNPATGATIATYYTHTPAQVEARLAQAAAAQRSWAERPLAERCAALVRLAAILRAGRDTYARLIVNEMGKPLVEAEAEIEKSALTCEFYAERAPGFLADTPVVSAAADSRVVYDPLGVVLAVMPGTIRSGSSSASPHRRWSPAMVPSSSTPATCRAALWRWSRRLPRLTCPPAWWRPC